MYSFVYLFALFVYNVTTLYRGIKNIYIYIYTTSDKKFIIIAVNYANEHPEDFRLIPSNIA